MLIYPTTAQHVDEEMLVQGHRIRVVTVNLAHDWEAIETHLLDLVNSRPSARIAGPTELRNCRSLP